MAIVVPTESDTDSILEEGDQLAAVSAPLRRLPFAFARRHGVVLLEAQETGADGMAGRRAACRPDARPLALAEARRMAGCSLAWEVLEAADFEALLERSYARDSSEARQMVEDLGDELDLASLADQVPETEDLLEQEDDAPIIRLINAILAEAIKEGASDIHIETFERELIVRFRVDGILREIVRPKRVLAPLLVSRIKVMARLDIAEKRIPQDGRITLRIAGREVDVRVSTLPSAAGERVVLRLLDKQAGRLDLTHLGMPDHGLHAMREILARPHGIVLVTGPTGSGKTTTLYASLGEIRSSELNIMTVEDPIEYNLPGIGQTQVHTKAGMSFARGLRAILRQDPDVVMVGEIRDLETAEIAIQAALTGHLVLSTLHTNTAIGAVTRLHDIGIEPYLLSSSMLALMAQRLVRVLCTECRESYQASDAECEVLGVDAADAPTLYAPVGCDHCAQSGYRGRTGIYEIIQIDEELRDMIHRNASEHEMERYAHARAPNLSQDGRTKVLAGVTSVQELFRVTRED
ncbi:MAG: type II secretion system protein GspE [Gammaproteobacteria bacterium]|nr:MAG: type II secretion system protein GspE [Gammaproteobacteria bacterium]